MENDRREDSQAEPVSPRTDAPAYQEPERRDEDTGGGERSRSEYSDSAEPVPHFSEEGNIPSQGAGESSDQPPPQGSQPVPPLQDRGGGRGGGGGGRRGRRLPPRDRRNIQGGGRDRRRGGNRPGFPSSHQGGGGFQQHGPPQRDPAHDVPRSESHNRPETRPGSVLYEVSGEVERVREVLEGVLRDLEDVAEQLVKAEHEKDLAEAEIEQLREQLRRLHR